MRKRITRCLSRYLLPIWLFTPVLLHADDRSGVKLGVLTTLSGSVAEWGQNTREGMQLALTEVNAEGGVHAKPLQLVFEDFADLDLKKAASGAQRLLQIEKVDVLLTQWAEDTEVAWPLALRQNVLTLTYSAGARDLTKGKRLLFRIWPSDESPIRRVIQYAATISKENPCIISQQAAYFESMRVVAEEEWFSITKKKARSVEHGPGVNDFRPYVLPLRECSSILILSEQNLLPSLLRQLKSLESRSLILGFPGMAAQSLRDAAGAAANGVVYAAYPPATKEFAERYTRVYGHSPGVPAAAAYDAVRVLAHTMNRHGIAAQEIAEGLHRLKEFPGATGAVSFTADGDRAPLPSQLWQIIDGKAELLQ